MIDAKYSEKVETKYFMVLTKESDPEEIIIAIPEPKFDMDSEVIARCPGGEEIGRILDRFFDIDSNLYRYRILAPGVLSIYYEYELELKLPQPTND